MDLGPMEIGLILVIILIIFGAGKLPEVGGALGKAIREFKKEKDGIAEDTKVSTNNTNNAGTAQTVEVKTDTAKKS